jgi:two-component system alkaline phosphatase synthesis response regulator PhoP
MKSLGGNILLIDDEANLRYTLTRILQRSGFDVTTAANGEEALRRLVDNSFDLVLLDIRLPGLSGLEVLERIRKQDIRIPVILLTAHGTLQSALDAIRLGATDYILKPVNPELLLNRTQSLVREQAIHRRKIEIQSQLEALQAELRMLEQGEEENTAPQLGSAAASNRYMTRGDLVLDLQARRAVLAERQIELAPSTFDYLLVLARHAPDVVSYQSLVAEAQNYQVTPNEARELAKWHIHGLRQALELDAQQPQFILNVRGVGYRLLMD